MDSLPPNAPPYITILQQEVATYWPLGRFPSVLAAQIEQESCISVRHPLCWSPRVELKTAREYGFGLGQITITAKFNNFLAATRLDKSLNDWRFEDRYDGRKQIRTLLLMNAGNYKLVGQQATEVDRLAMTLAAYNGGLGGVYSDVRVCKGTKGCDPTKWFGNVEFTSLKNKIPAPGYGETFFTTNHCYPWRVMYRRREKYDFSFPRIDPFPANVNGLECK